MLVKQVKIIPIRYKENYTDKINEFLKNYSEHEIIDIQYGITSDDDTGGICHFCYITYLKEV